MSLSKVTLAFDPQKTVAQEVIKRDEHRNIPKYFDLLVKTGAETPQKQENATL
jgi:hypothetical protein